MDVLDGIILRNLFSTRYLDRRPVFISDWCTNNSISLASSTINRQVLLILIICPTRLTMTACSTLWPSTAKICADWRAWMLQKSRYWLSFHLNALPDWWNCSTWDSWRLSVPQVSLPTQPPLRCSNNSTICSLFPCLWWNWMAVPNCPWS